MIVSLKVNFNNKSQSVFGVTLGTPILIDQFNLN